MAELTEEEYSKIEEELGDPILMRSLYGAARKNPDQSAEIIKFADSQNLPLDTVERNENEVRARHNSRNIDPDEIAENSPITAEYLKDERNARVSIDDIPVLRAMESVLNPDVGIVTNTIRGMGSRGVALIGNMIQLGGRKLGDPLKILRDFSVEDSSLKEMEPLGEIVEDVGDWLSESKAARLGYVPDFTWEKFKGDMTPANFAGMVLEVGGSSLVDSVAILASLPAYLASRTEEIAESHALNDSREGDVSDADLVQGFYTAVVVSFLERIGAKAIFDVGPVKTAKEGLAATLEAAVKEGLTEFVQEPVEYLGETIGTEKPLDFWEGLDRALAGFLIGAPMGGAVRGTSAIAQVLTNRIDKTTTRVARSMDEQLQIQQFITLSQDSKTRGRAQDRFQAFLKAAGKGRGVYVSAAEILKLVDSGVNLPRYITEQAIGDGDVEIPMDRFATDIAPNEELLAALKPHIRLSSDTLTTAELDEGVDTSIEKLMAKVNENEDLKNEADEIWEKVRDQIVATGRQGTETAKWSAMLIPARAVQVAEKYGITVTEAYEMMNFRVVGPAGVPVRPGGQSLQEHGTLPNREYDVARTAAFDAAKDDQDEIARLRDIDEKVGLGQMTNAEGVEAMRGAKPDSLTQQSIDEEGNVFEITINKRHVNKKINMIEELVRCMSA